MIAIIGVAFLLAIIFGPMAWTRWTMRRHAIHRDDYPGTGGEFARHILDLSELQTVPVEITDQGDHYDPSTKTVRLSRDNFEGKSVTAVAVAAHEVGHALQDRDQYQPLIVRTQSAKIAHWCQLIARGLLIAAPLVMAASPRLALLQLGAAIVIMAGRVVVSLVTLPVEFDASFKRALPILVAGNYMNDKDLIAANSVLRAAAFTYVAGALASIINVIRWFRMGR